MKCRFRQIWTALFSASALFGFQTRANSQTPDASVELGKILQTVRERYHLPAMAAVVVRGNRVIAENAVGVRELGKPDRITLDDKFMMGSLSKRMTGLAVGRLVDAGKLSFDTTLGEALSDINMRDDYRQV